jgi:hypothetical protein
MSILEFFRRSKNPPAKTISGRAERKECDINKTHQVVALLKVPRAARDTNWYISFYENVGNASFACGTPQLLTGPDGFPYFILRSPEENKPFESFCIENMKDDFLLEKGWGVVFNPAEDKSADWVFTYGDIVNFHINKRFKSPVAGAALAGVEFKGNVGHTTASQQVMVGQPSQTYLPEPTRNVLRSFLQSKGIRNPKVMLVSSYDDGQTARRLALNIPPENYPDGAQLDQLMQQVGWFLPNDYILIPLSKKSELAKGFNDL